MNQERKEMVYCLTAIFLMTFMNFFITIIHELGHAIAIVLLGGTITEFVVTPFNGGYVWSYYNNTGPVGYDTYITLIKLCGGFAVALFFVLVGFFKRPFLVMVPLNIAYGFAEVLSNLQAQSTIVHLFSLFTVIICLHFLYVKLWKGGIDELRLAQEAQQT